MKKLASTLSLESQTGLDLGGPTSTLWSIIRREVVQLEEEDIANDKQSERFKQVKQLQDDGLEPIDIARRTGLPGRVILRMMSRDKDERDYNWEQPYTVTTIVAADMTLAAASERLKEEQAKER